MKKNGNRAKSPDDPTDDKRQDAPDDARKEGEVAGQMSAGPDPFVTFKEWDGPADTKSYADLGAPKPPQT